MSRPKPVETMWNYQFPYQCYQADSGSTRTHGILFYCFAERITTIISSMENIYSFVSDIVKLWNLYQLKESLYKEALTLEDLGPLRRTCSQGFMISLLFKKEIHWLYDQVKSMLDDGDIDNFRMKQGLHNLIVTSESKSLLTDMILEQENKTIRLYRKILDSDNLSYETHGLLTDHFEKLKEINFTLQHQTAGLVKPQYISQPAVA